MFILQFLFFIFIIFLIAGLFIALRIYVTIRRTAGKFRNFANGGFRQQGSAGKEQRSEKKKGNVIIDTRSEEEAKRKIFPDEVGEYVKYKDVK